MTHNDIKKKILIVMTGGTIAMRYDVGEGVVPSDDLVNSIRSFPQLDEVAEINVHEFSNIPSPHMTPERMFELAKFVDISIIDYDGVVITHGTDTLEETAYLLDLVLTTRKPVVFTAAMRSGNEVGLDGPRNIIGAVRVASHPDSLDNGVLVVMNDEIHTARDVVKADTGMLNSFISQGNMSLGIIDNADVIFHRKSMHKEKIWTEKIDKNVDLIKATVGMDDRYIQASIDKKAHGLVIEAFGKGNLPPVLVPAIKRAIEAGIVVIIVSRTYTGRVLPEYGYDGGSISLVDIGALLGSDLRGPKARIKLMCLLGRYESADLVKKFY
ncbi:MAG: asparaginase [Candidatus Cloacimonetes bacterium]|nr:asparaginase [Candidatus Cloacimonadota bacterium]